MDTECNFMLIECWFDDCSRIGNIGYIVEYEWFSRQHFGDMKSNKRQHFRSMLFPTPVIHTTVSSEYFNYVRVTII